MNNGTIPFVGLRGRLLAMTALSGLCAAGVVLSASDTQAAGFALKEQSAAAQGNSFAGATAGAEDVTYMFFNPAALALIDENQIGGVLSYIDVTADTNNANSAIFGDDTDSGGGSAIVPAIYGMWSISSDLKLGLGINVPFGLSTSYPQDWAGQFYAIESEIHSININPVLSYRFNDMFSVAAGLQIQTVEVTLSNTLPVAGFPLFEVEGDDWGYGFNLGAMIEFSEGTRLGLSYRSRIVHELSGTATVASAVSTGATADFTSPDTASIGFYHEFTPQWAVMAEAAWTGWSTFDEIRIEMAENIGLGPTAVVEENWDDSWFYGAGLTWRPTPQWSIRTGVAFDQSPIPDATRTPRIPGNDRTWVSLGAGFEVSPAFKIDAGYTHILVDDGNVELNTGTPGEFTATFENSVDIITVQGIFKF